MARPSGQESADGVNRRGPEPANRLGKAARPHTRDDLPHRKVRPDNLNMATMTINSTYSLDVDTVRALEGLARRWNVSKSEALRRAIRHEAERQLSRADARLQVLRALQKSVAARGVDLDAWERQAAEIRSDSFRMP